MNYFHCLHCKDIPKIKKINDDEVSIYCEKHGENKIKINEFINNCIGICECEYCNNIPMYLIDNKFFLCENCLNEYPPKPIESKKLLKDFYCDKCDKHKNLLIDYCLDCKESKCEKCKKDDKNNHNYLNDNLKEEKKFLYNEIMNSIMNSEKKIKILFDNLEKKLISYKLISFNKNSIFTTNIQILNIIKNIQNKEKIFFEKMKETKTEFENFLNFDIKDNKLDFFIEQEKYDELKKICSQLKDNNKQMFQKPENKLYKEFSINLTDVINKNKYIIQKIEKISYNIEEEIKLNERNNLEDKLKLDERDQFLISVACVAREADNYSKYLFEILKEKFYDENKNFNQKKYNEHKIEISSWVKQSLIKDESNDDIKDLRLFYKYLCEKENKRIQKFLNLDSSIYIILKKHNFDFQKLFRILSQLYTEVLLCSDKNIYLKYAEKCYFDRDIMKDITDLNGERFVIFSVLPGLFVNESNTERGKILVFCDKNKNLKTNILNKYKLDLKDNTIAKVDINYKVKNIAKVDINYNVKDKKYHIKIKREPQLEIENLKFKVNINDSSKSISSLDKEETEYNLEKDIVKNKRINVIVEIF